MCFQVWCLKNNTTCITLYCSEETSGHISVWYRIYVGRGGECTVVCNHTSGAGEGFREVSSGRSVFRVPWKDFLLENKGNLCRHFPGFTASTPLCCRGSVIPTSTDSVSGAGTVWRERGGSLPITASRPWRSPIPERRTRLSGQSSVLAGKWVLWPPGQADPGGTFVLTRAHRAPWGEVGMRWSQGDFQARHHNPGEHQPPLWLRLFTIHSTNTYRS